MPYSYLQSGVKKLLAWPGIEATTLDLSLQSDAFDHSAMYWLRQWIYEWYTH